MFKLRGLIFFCWLISFSYSYGESLDLSYEKAKAFANTMKQKPINTMKAFNPNEVFNGYTSHPEEEKYYKGVKDEHNSIDKIGKDAVNNDVVTKKIYDDFGVTPRININKNDVAIKNALTIEAESYALTHGISTADINCDEKETDNCTPSFIEKTCEINSSSCADLINEGCQNIAVRCKNNSNNQCESYERLYQCPKNVCKNKIVCTKKVFCSDGQCVDKVITSNSNYAQSVSALSAVSAAGDAYQKNNVSLFSGRVQTCKIRPINFLDCCSNRGWGKKLNLSNCSHEDISLGEAKLNYLVHFLGKYCSKKWPWPAKGCQTWKNTYCVFDSKMARIIQEEGRLKQLNSNALGDAKNPSCQGLSIEEMQSIDMGQINFINPNYPFSGSESTPNEQAGIAGDIHLDSKNSNNIVEEIKKRIEQRSNG